MKRLLVLAACLAALLVPAAAEAHPLGNFTTNRYSELVVSGDRLYAVYVLDLAEIPTFQDRSTLARLGRDGYAQRLAGRVAQGLAVEAGGRRLPLRELQRRLTFPQGVGGLKTTRLELVFDAGPADAARQLGVRDTTFRDRVGWKEIVIRADRDAQRDRSLGARRRARPTGFARIRRICSGARSRSRAPRRRSSPEASPAWLPRSEPRRPRPAAACPRRARAASRRSSPRRS